MLPFRVHLCFWIISNFEVFFSPHKLRAKIVNIKAFNLNENLMQYFDYNNVDDLAMGLGDDLGLVVGSISTHSTSSIGKNIPTTCKLNL